MHGGFFFFFQIIEALLSLKNAWSSPIFFFDTKSTCKSTAFSTILNCTTKEETQVSRDAQNVCAVTKVGTILKLIVFEHDIYLRTGISSTRIFFTLFDSSFKQLQWYVIIVQTKTR